MRFLKNLPNPMIGFLQATGLSLYCTGVGLFILGAETWFGPMTAPFGMLLFLLLFIVSALISASMILAYPAWLFYQKKVSMAIDIGIWTVFWLLAILLLLALSLVR